MTQRIRLISDNHLSTLDNQQKWNLLAKEFAENSNTRYILCGASEHDHSLSGFSTLFNNDNLHNQVPATVNAFRKMLGNNTIEWITGAYRLPDSLELTYSDKFIRPDNWTTQNVLYDQAHLFDRVHYFPTYWLFLGFLMFSHNREYPLQPNTDFEHTFICRNNRGHWHRCAQIDALEYYGLLDDNLWSWRQPDTVPEGYGKVRPPVFRHFENRVKTLAESSDTPDDMFSNSDPLEYDSALIDLVTESDPGSRFFTEKTLKPLLSEKPFIIHGAQNQNSDLAELFGFQLYTELFDYGFETQRDFIARANSIAYQLYIINRQERHHKVTLWQSTRNTAEFNLRRLLEMVINHEGVPDIVWQINAETKATEIDYPDRIMRGGSAIDNHVGCQYADMLFRAKVRAQQILQKLDART